MKDKDVQLVNEYLARFHGGEVAFGNYIEEHDCLVIGFYCKDMDPVGVSFVGTVYLSGPTRWINSELVCSLFNFDDGGVGIELEDKASGFVAKCYGPVIFGDTGKVVPTT